MSTWYCNRKNGISLNEGGKYITFAFCRLMTYPHQDIRGKWMLRFWMGFCGYNFEFTKFFGPSYLKPIILKDYSDFFDFSQRPVFKWIIQSLIFPSVYFYYDDVQKAYCREIKNVKVTIEDGYKVPHSFLVKYKQKIW